MIKDKKIRLAVKNDCTSILEIYAPYINDTVITFEYQIPTRNEFSERMDNIQKKYPWLVCEIDGKIVGYAYASSYREREAYKWSVDFSVYIHQDYHRKNIGKALYTALIEILKLQGFNNAYAGITVPNIKSESLHEAFGFKEIGLYPNVGYKFGKWHTVKWYGLKINEYVPTPLNPKSIDEISTSDDFMKILENAELRIKTR